ncbi:putative deaminase, partial [Mitosporidium daphniae]
LDFRYPLPHMLGHVKRVKKSERSISILLWPLEDTNRCFDFLRNYSIFKKDLFTASVPKLPPRTKENWLEANQLWPVTLHIIIPKFPSWESFDGQYKRFVTSKVLKPSSTLFNPLSLSVVVEIGQESCQISMPLLHPTMLILNQLALLILKEKQSKPPDSGLIPPNAYLATGFDLILQEEPCIMLALDSNYFRCSMALVHSRIRRVFYVRSNRKRGGLGGSSAESAVHTNPQLNHHFGVYVVEENASKGGLDLGVQISSGINASEALGVNQRRIVPFRPSLKDLNAPLIHLIDAKGSISNDISSSEILNKYDAQKYELLQVGIRDSVPIIKVFPKVTPKDPLQSSREPSPHRQKPREEKEKTIEMNSTIGGNDFEHKMHMLNCFLAKVIRVKVLLTLRGTSSALDLENLFAKIKARIDASGVGEVVAPVQQAAKKVQFVVRPKLTPEYP